MVERTTPLAASSYALVARDIAIDVGWDSFSVEAIGNQVDLDWLTNTFVHPSPGILVPPNPIPDPLDNGFVIQVADADAYGDAIQAKIQEIVTPAPEPTTLTLLAVGLGLGLMRRASRSED